MNLAIKDMQTTLEGIQRDIQLIKAKIERRQEELCQKQQLAAEFEVILEIAQKMESE